MGDGQADCTQTSGQKIILASAKLNLIDLCHSGTSFTRTNKQERLHKIKARLDRACATSEWITDHPCAKVIHLPPTASDHIPRVNPSPTKRET